MSQEGPVADLPLGLRCLLNEMVSQPHGVGCLDLGIAYAMFVGHPPEQASLLTADLSSSRYESGRRIAAAKRGRRLS
jgi:hypothetical protein